MGTAQPEVITLRQWQGHAKRLERKAMNATGRSATFGTIARAAQTHIIENIDEETMLVTPGWRDSMRAASQGATKS